MCGNMGAAVVLARIFSDAKPVFGRKLKRRSG
jgi:hypothetical protein